MQVASGGVLVGPLSQGKHLDAAVELQRRIWGYTDVDVDSRAMLVIAQRFVGQLLGAFDGETLIGLALSFRTAEPGRLHSHRLGVLPEYQNRGVGRTLKLAQRDAALAEGVEIIQWTFDPLQSRNAHVNLVRLGALARTYLPNLYGFSSSVLHGALPTDRLLVEWELASPRVEAVLSGTVYVPRNSSVRIELPMVEERASAAQQSRIAHEFQTAFAQGYVVTGFVSGEEPEYYILEVL